MIEEFSGGYYRAEMSVQPLERGPTIEQGLYQLVNEEIYQQTDAPVTMRVTLDAGPTFTPSIESAIPPEVIGLPTAFLDRIGVHPSSESVNVFILKPKYAYMFNESKRIGEDLYQYPDISIVEGDD